MIQVPKPLPSEAEPMRKAAMGLLKLSDVESLKRAAAQENNKRARIDFKAAAEAGKVQSYLNFIRYLEVMQHD